MDGGGKDGWMDAGRVIGGCMDESIESQWLSGRMNGWMDEWVNGWMGEWMNGWMDEWMNGWMGEWMNGWMGEWGNGGMNEWMNGWMDEWVNGWMGEWMNGCMGEWMNGWMDEWVDGWMDEWMNGWMDEWMDRSMTCKLQDKQPISLRHINRHVQCVFCSSDRSCCSDHPNGEFAFPNTSITILVWCKVERAFWHPYNNAAQVGRWVHR